MLDVIDDFLLPLLRKSDLRSFLASLVGEIFRLHLLQTNVDARVGNLQRSSESGFAHFDAFEEVFSSHFPTTALLVLRVAALLWNLVDARVEEGAATLVAADAPEHVEDLPAGLLRQFRRIGAVLWTRAHESLVEFLRLHLLTFGIDVAFVGVGPLLSDFTGLVGNYTFSAFWLTGI